ALLGGVIGIVTGVAASAPISYLADCSARIGPASMLLAFVRPGGRRSWIRWTRCDTGRMKPRTRPHDSPPTAPRRRCRQRQRFRARHP
ncbi:MAG: hypothetical protein AAB654_00980, partial [Acidobacteriota bacterium]